MCKKSHASLQLLLSGLSRAIGQKQWEDAAELLGFHGGAEAFDHTSADPIYVINLASVYFYSYELHGQSYDGRRAAELYEEAARIGDSDTAEVAGECLQEMRVLLMTK